MATETPAAPSARPRPWLLVALGVALVLFLVTRYWPASAPPAVPPRAPTGRAKAVENGTIDPEALKVRLDELKAPRPEPGDGERNPFRFYVKPPPPPPVNPNPPVFKPPPEPPPPVELPPPIPLKFIGIIEGRGVGRIAAFSDCKRTFNGREGDIVDGRYKLLKIGLESVTMAHLDPKWPPQVIRLSGQDCIGK
jgi:hypothetical protein